MEAEQPTESTPRSKSSAVFIAKIVTAALLIATFTIFAIQNAASVDVEFLAWDFTMRRIFLMALSASIGIVVWELVGFVWRRRRRS